MAKRLDCQHCPTEQLVDMVLRSSHERLQQRCDRDKILAVFERTSTGRTMRSVCTRAASVSTLETCWLGVEFLEQS